MMTFSNHFRSKGPLAGVVLLVQTFVSPILRAEEPAALFTRGKALYADQSSTGELKRAAALIEEAAVSGHSEAQGFFGFLLSRGEGVPRDDEAAAVWMRKAAEAGVASAQLNLGLMILRGRVKRESSGGALAWIVKAAEAGHLEARVRLAEIYFFGERGIEKDPGKSLHWARLAAEQGNAWAQNLLATLLESGTVGKVDRKEAMVWYRRAAEQGNAKAQSSLGRLYESGLVGERDVIEAYYWLWQAVEQNEATAIVYLKDLVPGMTPEEREAALERIGKKKE